MLNIYINIDDDIIINKFNINNLPYYIININNDIELIKKNNNISNICFSNSLTHFNNEIKLLKNTTNIKICPERDNIIKYTNWFIDNVDITNNLSKYDFIEVPLFFNEYFYSTLLNKNKKKYLSITNSLYFNNYIECLYINESKQNNEYKIINNFNDLKLIYETTFIQQCNLYLNKISEVSHYINQGNFYGQQTSQYEKKLIDFKNSLKDS
jgi:hypothetical protein